MRLICYGLLLALLLHESPVAAEESRSPATFHRIPENDAANCLYLQLRLLGYRDGYDVFREQLPTDRASLTFKEMAAIGQRLGFRHSPVKLKVSELVSARTPVILHFESQGVNSGQFMLFLWMYDDETKVALIDGSNVTFRELSRDEFRRSWTGYALLVSPSIDWGAWARRSAAILVCAGLCFCLVAKADRSGGWRKSLRYGFKSWGSTHQERIGHRDALLPDD